MDKSKSPHFVKRLETKDPYGSTVAPVPTILNVPHQMCCQQTFFTKAQFTNKIWFDIILCDIALVDQVILFAIYDMH